MFKKKNKEVSEVDSEGKTSRTVVTETFVTSGGVQTTRKIITTSSNQDMDSALKEFNMDAEKFRLQGTSVTRTTVKSINSGQKEVVEEFVETYDDSSSSNDTDKKSKSSKPLMERLGLKSSKTANETIDANTSSGKKSSNDTAVSCMKLGKFEDDCLKAHNAYRAKHGVPNLKLSKQICAYSKEWADHLAATDGFQHRTEKKYGENIYMKWSSDPQHTVLGSDAVDSWYSEIKDHKFGCEPTSLKSGHFTQVIWKESKEMGVAWSRSKKGKVLVVANYDPPGNFVGRFAQNVPPPKN